MNVATGRCPGCGCLNNCHVPERDGKMSLIVGVKCSECGTRASLAPFKRSNGCVMLIPVQEDEYIDDQNHRRDS